MFEDTPISTPQATPSPAYSEIFPTAAALLWQDRVFICVIYPLLVVVSLCVVALPNPSISMLFAASVLERVLQTTFIYLVYTRWIKRLAKGPRPIGFLPTLQFFGFGLLIWAFFAIPFMLSFSYPDSTMPVVSFALIGTFCWLWLRYYFYPLPILLGCKPLKRSLAIAQDLNRGTRALPIKLLIAPAGFLLLCTAIAMSPSPDGRLMWVNYCMNATVGIFWVFAVYLSLAASLLRLDDQVWRENNLDPYRVARLSTLEFQGSSWLARQLRPKQGLGWIAIGALVWIGNWTRLSTMPPAGTLEIEKLSISGPKVTVELHLSDPHYHFQGLEPVNFALAGEARSIISHAPDNVKLAGDQSPADDDDSLNVPNNATDIHVTLNFTANRSGKDLVSLKDLYLWYRSARLDHLDMDKAVLEQP